MFTYCNLYLFVEKTNGFLTKKSISCLFVNDGEDDPSIRRGDNEKNTSSKS